MGSIAMEEGTIGERHDLRVGDVVLLSAGTGWRAKTTPVTAMVEKVEGSDVTVLGADDGERHHLPFGPDAPPEYGYRTLRPAETFAIGTRWEGYDAGARRWRPIQVTETRPATDIGEHGTLPPTAKFRFLDGLGYYGRPLDPGERADDAGGYVLLPAPLATVRRMRSHAELVTDADVSAWRRGVIAAAGPTVSTAISMLTTDDVRAGIGALDAHRAGETP